MNFTSVVSTVAGPRCAAQLYPAGPFVSALPPADVIEMFELSDARQEAARKRLTSARAIYRQSLRDLGQGHAATEHDLGIAQLALDAFEEILFS